MLSSLVKDNTRNVVQQTQQQVHGFQQQLQPQHAAAIRQSQQVRRFVVSGIHQVILMLSFLLLCCSLLQMA